MIDSRIKITKKPNIKGDDGYKTFSVRIKSETVAMLDDMSKKSKRSRNELINMMLEYGVETFFVEE